MARHTPTCNSNLVPGLPCNCEADFGNLQVHFGNFGNYAPAPVPAPTLPLTMDLGRPARYMAPPELDHFYPGDPIRAIEKASIRFFMERHRGLLRGRVLDFGAGKQPYRDLVEGEYIPVEKGESVNEHTIAGTCDAVISNQVFQYLHESDPAPWRNSALNTLLSFHRWLKPGGCAVITYATCWPDFEPQDHERLTKAGMESILAFQFGSTERFRVEDHQLRAEIVIGGVNGGNFRLALGYGVVARKV